MRRLFLYAFQGGGNDGWSGGIGDCIALETLNEHTLRSVIG